MSAKVDAGRVGHTPGPWSVAPSSNPGNGTAWRDIVSYGTAYTPSYVGEALEQDAALIAAAPELLAACQAALRSLSSQRKYITDDLQAIGHNSDAMESLTRAIARATGQAV